MSTSPNVTPHATTLTREHRWRTLQARGATIWITGLPSSGKSTLGAAIEERLVELGRGAYLLDGDNMRCGLCSDLGFERDDREQNVRRVGELALLFADAGTVAIVAVVSPYAQMRAHVRERHEQDGLPFFEVFVDTPVKVCAQRDPKGLYARAYAGDLDGFTGVDDPYQPPRKPDLRVTPELALSLAVDAVLDLLGTPRLLNDAATSAAASSQR
ncbi:MAG TPA: adenylyl-sulfate kinase [Solirubrobacteraceae bacterium]|jgi:bifunctional enzyme CysN/CysC|nr:adenylyl-sulfate kinase [Solirubrobacteraceae bacterium]